MAERSNCRSDVLVLRALTQRRKMEKRDYSTCKQNLTVYNCLCTIHKHLVYGSYPLPYFSTPCAEETTRLILFIYIYLYIPFLFVKKIP
jgi:hypothetical protein